MRLLNIVIQFLIVLCIIPLSMGATVNTQITSSTDDAFTYSDGTGYSSSSVYHFLGDDGDPFISGYRFQNIQILPGADITEATLTVMSSWNRYGTVHLKISGDDVDDSVTFSSGNAPDDRTQTTAKVDWDITAAWYEDVWYDSPDIKTVVQEIIDRPGWSSGNDITILIDDDGSSAVKEINTYDQWDIYSAKLEIVYDYSPVYAGWRSSEYGYQQEADPDYWTNVSEQMASKVDDAVSGGIWILGVDWGDGTCGLSFPNEGSYTNIEFNEEDLNEDYLDEFDAEGVKVFLQVEPASANVSELIELVLDEYGDHECVIGFGVDVEWLDSLHYENGKPVTNAEALEWVTLVQSYDPDYKLFLKHWDSDWMPTTHYDGVVYICDSLDYLTLSGLIGSFQEDWADDITDAYVGYQIGYDIDVDEDEHTDKDWWNTYNDPADTISDAIMNNISNCRYIYWVDFTITDVFPDE